MCWLTGPIDSLKTCLYYFEPVRVETLCSLSPHHLPNQNDLYTQRFTNSEILGLRFCVKSCGLESIGPVSQHISTAHIFC